MERNSNKVLFQFIQTYEKDYGKKLTLDEAQEKLNKLKNLLRALYHSDAEVDN